MKKLLSAILSVILCACLIAPLRAAASDSKALRLPTITKETELYALGSTGLVYIGGALAFWGDELPVAYDRQSTMMRDYRLKIQDGLAAFEGLKPANTDAKIASHGFLIWDSAGKRHAYGFSADSHFVADGAAYELPKERRARIVAMHEIMTQNQAYPKLSAYPAWLVWMTPEKITETVFYSPKRGAVKLSQDPEIIDYIVWQTRQSVSASANDTYRPDSVDLSGKDVFRLEIKFNTGVTYKIFAKNAKDSEGHYHLGQLFVESSDKTYGCRYLMDSANMDGPANNLITHFEWIADAKSIDDLDNPLT